MWKKNKGKIVVSSLLLLVPMLAGGILWSRLPERIAVHWDMDNAPNGWAGRAFVVFGLPALLLGLHLLCLAVTAADPRRKNIGKKPLGMVYWLIPAIGLPISAITYAAALGVKVNMGMVCCILLGLLFIVVGNVMPKARQNYTFGFRTPWALHDAENWRRTQRFAGWCMVGLGVIMLVMAFRLNLWVLFGAVALCAAAPYVYSYIYYRRHGEVEE